MAFDGQELACEVLLRVPEDQRYLLPAIATLTVPHAAPMPRQGEVVFIGSSAWGVQLVVHEWSHPRKLRVEIWLEHVSCTRHASPSGFALRH